jgi:hypothetical protein
MTRADDYRIGRYCFTFLMLYVRISLDFWYCIVGMQLMFKATERIFMNNHTLHPTAGFACLYFLNSQ